MAIPKPELQSIRRRLDGLQGPVKLDYFHQSKSALLIPGRQPCPTCDEVKEALEEIAALSDKLDLRVYEFEDERKMARKRGIDRVPATVIRGEVNRPLRFYGMPAGAFLPFFVQALMEASGKPPQPPQDVARTLKKLRSKVALRVFGSFAHPPSAEAAGVVYGLALASPRVEATVYEIEEFPALAQQLGVKRIPTTLVAEQAGFAGVATAAALATYIYDLQAHPQRARLAGPQAASASAAPWQAPAPPQTAAQPGAPAQPRAAAALPDERRTPGGLIIPGR